MNPPQPRDHYYQTSAMPHARDLGPLTDAHLKLLIRNEVEAVRRESDAGLIKNMDERFKTMTDTFLSAFPNNDPGEHRRAHERDIAAANGWAKIRADLLSKILTGGLWAGLIFVSLATWEYLKKKVHG